MILSSTTSVLDRKFGYKKAVEILARAGFDAVDLSLVGMKDPDNIFNSDKYLEETKSLIEVAKNNGVSFNQAHACFPTAVADEDETKIAFEKVKRGIEIAGTIGAKVIVVHPQQYLYYPEGRNAEILKEMNYKFYKSLMPYCEKYGVKVATENVYRTGKISKVYMDNTCSRGSEFCEYVDMIESDWMTACLDLGHCGLVGQTPENMIRELGRDRLGALHVHDNDGRRDYHVEPMAPFLCSIDWEEVCKALAEIDYKGDFTFEADCVFKNVNEVTVDSAAKYLHDIGRHLISRIEYYKESVQK